MVDAQRPRTGSDGDGDYRVAVLGAGVIGRVLAALLVHGGVDTTLVARGRTLRQLRANGIRLWMVQGSVEQVAVPTADVAAPGQYDQVFVCVRVSDLDQTYPVLEAMGKPLVVPMMHLGGRYADLVSRFGADSVVRGFPGFGGYINDDGTVEWLDLKSKQPTTLDAAAPGYAQVLRTLQATGLVLEGTDDMAAWMAVHVVFVATLAAAVVKADGDLLRLAGDRALIRRTVEAIRDGFHALTDRGMSIEPTSIRVLFTRMPTWFAVAYWQRPSPVRWAPSPSRPTPWPVVATSCRCFGRRRSS